MRRKSFTWGKHDVRDLILHFIFRRNILPSCQKDLAVYKKKKVWVSHYFLAKMELRKFRTWAVRATGGRGRKGKFMQINGKKEERFSPRSSRLHRSPLTRAFDLLWLKRNIRVCSLTHLSVFSKQHIIRNNTTEVEHVHIILNSNLKVG